MRLLRGAGRIARGAGVLIVCTCCVLSISIATAGAPPPATPPAQLPAQPTASVQRIAALAPSLTELVYAAGAGEKLVAVAAFSDFPTAAKALPQVSDYSGINVEALMLARPDLVLVWGQGTREKDIERLHTTGYKIERIDVVRLTDVPVALTRIGALVGVRDKAEQAAARFSGRLDALAARYQKLTPVAVFFEIGRTPLMTVNQHHFISEVIRLCGGVNVFAEVRPLVFQPSREELIARNPRLILYGGNLPKERDNAIYEGTTAKREDNIIRVHADHILRPGPRLIDGAEAVCAQIDAVRQKASKAR
jgi:iron complex transport system substrate-binding protein